MMKFKKWISLLLAVVLAVSSLAASTIALADTSGDFEYTVLDDGTAEITGYTGNASELVIPSEIDGYTVKSIGYGAFWGCKYLKSVTISNSVKEIKESAYGHYYYPFYQCSSLEEIIVDSNNPNYSSLDGVLFNKSLTKILHYPEGKKDSTYILPKTVTEVTSDTDIYYYPFMLNNYLKHIIFPETVTYIGRTVATTNLENASITILNPNCVFADRENTQGEQCFYGFKNIYGFSGSTAQQVTYLNFIALEEPVGGGIATNNMDIMYTIGLDNNVTIYCTYNLSDFINVTIDYKTVSPLNYTLAEGSTILTFDPDYLATLSIGEHTVTLNYTNASVSSVLTIIANTTVSEKDTISESENTSDSGTSEKNNVSDKTEKVEADNQTQSSIATGAGKSTKSPSTGANSAMLAALTAGICAGTAVLITAKGRRRQK